MTFLLTKLILLSRHLCSSLQRLLYYTEGSLVLSEKGFISQFDRGEALSPPKKGRVSFLPIETGGLVRISRFQSGALEKMLLFRNTRAPCVLSGTSFQVLKSHISIHYSLDFNVMVLISTKIVGSVFYWGFYPDVGTIYSTNNIRQSRPQLKTFSCSYNLFLGFGKPDIQIL